LARALNLLDARAYTGQQIVLYRGHMRFVLVFTGLLLETLCLGQSFTSSITGVVADPSGASVANASLELKNIDTSDVHNFKTQIDGTYQFNNLAPGNYELAVTAPGFKTHVQRNLILRAQTAATVNVALELGGTEQRVEVSESAVLVDTQTANNASTLDRQLIQALPNNTRNPLNFVFALAGTTEAPGGQTQRNGSLDQMSSNFGLNGGRTGNEQVLIDGAPSQAVDWGGLLVAPLQDSVQEQQIVVNSYDAQYERAGGGIVTLITKGGSSQFHGEAYDYLQNSVLNANYWSNNKFGVGRVPFKQNQFGGNFGGPILNRYHLFFFGGYEGFRQPNTQSTGLITVPTQAERNGDFSQALNADGSPDIIYNPFTTTPIGSTGNFTRQPFAGNVIPQNLFNPVGQKIAGLYPSPNRPGQGPNNVNNYFNQGPGHTDNDKMDLRVDWEQNAVHRLFVRFSDRFRQDITVPCFFCNGADTGVNQNNEGFQSVINDTITPSPTWVINAFVSYGRWREAHTGQGFGVASASTVGLENSLFQAPLLPQIYPDGPYSSLSNGSFQRYIRYSSTAQVNATKELAKHTLKFGFNYDVGMINSINEQAGSFNFSSALTSCDPASSGPCTALNNTSILSGNSIASMLLGTASGGGQGINIDPAMSLHTYGTYIQDQWRLISRLTINAGVRYENQRPATERFNRLMYFDPHVLSPVSAAAQPLLGRQVFGGFEYAGANNRYAWPANNHDFAPRIGLAYRVTNKLVARAGAGIFFLNPSAMITFDNPGQFYGFSSTTPYVATSSNGFIPVNLVSNPFPQGINQPTGGSQGLSTLLGNGLGQIWLKGPHPTGYTEQWSFDLQYQLGPKTIVEAAYTGNRGRKLLYGNPNLDADQLPTQYLSLGSKLDQNVPNPFLGLVDPNSYLGAPSTTTIAYNELLRPFPQFTYLQWTRSLPGASSQFDALNLKFNHAFSDGLSLLATYQWSKAMDNGPEDFFGWATGNQWRDAYHTNLDYNISTHDVPQSFAAALVYELPYGTGKKWGASAPTPIRYALGNWEVSTVTRLASGLPLPQVIASYSNHLNNYGFPGPQLPDIVPGQSLTASHQSPDNWINPNAFIAPASMFVYGNAAQRYTQLRERAARNIDLAVAKNFAVFENLRLQFRGEFLNLINYAQYNNFCLDLSGSSCGAPGIAYGTENSPRTIQGSLKLTF